MIAGGEAAPQEGAKQQRLMALYESRLTDSLGPVNAKTLARDIARDKPLDISAWLEARDVTLLGDKAVSVLSDLYAEAGWVGVCLARAELDYARTLGKADNPELSVDWSGWVPGDPDAARLLLSEAGTGLKGLLDRAAITIKGVNDSRVSELGNLLSRTVGEGASMRTTAAAIREQFGTGNKWSKTVAQTETRRAVTAASVDTYQGAGVGSVEWLTAWGEACPICQEFQDMGPVLIGSGAFDGDDGPPGHPNCFCVILPVIDPEMLRPVDETLDIEEIGGETQIESEAEQNLQLTPDQETAVYELNEYLADARRVKDIEEHADELDAAYRYVTDEANSDIFVQGMRDLRSYTNTSSRLTIERSPEARFLLDNVSPSEQKLYRGMRVDEESFQAMMKSEEGDLIDRYGLSSYSYDETVARSFAEADEATPFSVMVESQGPMRGVPLEPITMKEEEYEVLVGHGVRVVQVIQDGPNSLRIIVAAQS